jgi:predicted anti-sigma-YlaC factor YlaD
MTLPCIEVVELVSDYLEGALDPETERRVAEHLDLCPPCVTYVEQVRATVGMLGRLPDEALAPHAVAELEAAFRDFHRAR